MHSVWWESKSFRVQTEASPCCPICKITIAQPPEMWNQIRDGEALCTQQRACSVVCGCLLRNIEGPCAKGNVSKCVFFFLKNTEAVSRNFLLLLLLPEDTHTPNLIFCLLLPDFLKKLWFPNPVLNPGDPRSWVALPERFSFSTLS